ncbi:4-alpha-glucanotransferase [Thermocoleostomius sinensis]|uniref:4-alpha-glucanotransferase n=1 Tax=Thermocoleostomius sinensis A174 TaxID=2016057 RepID=A0A9E8ZD03_9CYAN|nr:4-alpha-glucanotransferase [Thermocoleostomius sinensis]WAL59592.1 4-alpha-glucanotransferase [Thermocoleostomius sinensis A174]
MNASSHPSVFSQRVSGILLHPTSFPGRFGIGDLRSEAYRFIDFLADSDQHLWQILPLGPTSFGNSPYMSYSAMAGNPLLISLDLLHGEGLLSDADLAHIPDFPLDHVDFDRVAATKFPLLQQACRNFATSASAERRDAFQQFQQEKADWLEDYALFMALKRKFNGQSWHTWEPGLAKRDKATLQQFRSELAEEIFFEEFLQFEFFRQWSDLKHYANSKGIQIIGDIPIYVAHDSADVWANPDNFCLDSETGEPALMAGTPPDYFSETGQLWGNPVYNWDYLQQSDFQWWIQRFEAMLDYVDLIRIDHFIGFESFWAIPQGETNAVNGSWIKAPGKQFFEVLKQKLGSLPILAEDLGTVTPEVEALRDHFEFPGMKVLHFAFGGDARNPYLPFNYDKRNCVVYTGTHDNNTTVAWYETLPDHERDRLLDYLGCISSDGIHWDMIRLAFGSIANLAIIPLQDILGLGSNARMNFPGRLEGNWGWRYRSEALNDETCGRLKHITQVFGRSRPRSEAEPESD